MKNKKTEFLSFNEIAKVIDSFSIKNFVLSGANSIKSEMPLNHPFACDGIIFGICINGSGRIRIDYTEYHIDANTILIILPGHIFEMLDKTDDFKIEALLFSIDFFTNIAINNFDITEDINRQSCLKISEEDTKALLDFHDLITREFARNKIYKEQIIRHMLIAMVISIAELYLKVNPQIRIPDLSRDEEIKNLFMKMLIESRGVIRDPNYFSDKIFVTTKHLSTVLKRATGRSLNSWINESIILKAKMLIKSTNMSILQISEELNFPNPSFFGKYFKKHTGLTPIQYKKS